MGTVMRYSDGRPAWRLRPQAYWAADAGQSPRVTELVREVAAERGLSPASIRRELDAVRGALRATSLAIQVVEQGYRRALEVVLVGRGPLELEVGPATMFEFAIEDHWERYIAVVFGPLTAEGGVPPGTNELTVRIDSACTSGQLFGDLTCDCRDQLDLSMSVMSDEGQGVVVHIPSQDGRGCGTPFKLATLGLQKNAGLDTVQAATLVSAGSHVDRRTYAGAVAVLRALGAQTGRRLALLSSNPDKARVLCDNGFAARLRPLDQPVRQQARRHLEAKRDKLGHTIEFDALDG
jgi:GTP cyclohydrolase II